MMLDVGAVFRLSDGGWLKYFCAFLGYGFFSDTLRNSEKRWLRRHLGKSRYLLAGARTFFVNRAYNGSVSFKTAGDIPEGYPDEGAQCYKGCGYCVDMGAGKSGKCAPRFWFGLKTMDTELQCVIFAWFGPMEVSDWRLSPTR